MLCLFMCLGFENICASGTVLTIDRGRNSRFLPSGGGRSVVTIAIARRGGGFCAVGSTADRVSCIQTVETCAAACQHQHGLFVTLALSG